MMIELLGNFPRSVTSTGKFCGDYFNRKGELKHIHRYCKMTSTSLLECAD